MNGFCLSKHRLIPFGRSIRNIYSCNIKCPKSSCIPEEQVTVFSQMRRDEPQKTPVHPVPFIPLYWQTVVAYACLLSSWIILYIWWLISSSRYDSINEVKHLTSATFHRKQTKPLSVARIALGESSFVPWVSLVYECIWKISVNELTTGVFRTSTMATSIITNVNKCCTYVYIYIRMYTYV